MRLLPSAVALWLALLGPSSEKPETAGPSPGDPVAELSGRTLDGNPFSLAEAVVGHKAVVFVFFSVSCPYSNLVSDHARELSAAYRDRGVLFVGVYSNRGESREEAIAYARQYRLRFPSLEDSGARVADVLGASVTPEAFLVDSRRRLRYRGQVRSKMGKPYLKEAIEAVLEDGTVRTPRAPAFGCFIVRD